MKPLRLFAAILVATMAVMAMGSAQNAWADPPVRDAGHFTYSFVSGLWSRLCGFPVTRAYDEYYTEISSTRHNGTQTDIFLQHGTETFSTPGGGSISGRIQGPFIDTLYPDGTETWLQAGQMQEFRVPGQGLIYGEGGSIYVEFDADGNIVTERQSGPLVDNAQAICDAIAP
jgi:hypothetical protein